MKISWRRVFWGVGADKLSSDEQSHIEYFATLKEEFLSR